MRIIGERWIARYISAIQWFIPANGQTDPAQLTRVQTFVNAVPPATLAGPLYAMAYFLLGFTSAAQIILVSCLIMALTPLLLRWTNSMFIARTVFLSTLFVNFSWLSYHLGGLTAPTTGWLITGPVVAMFLGGAGCSLFWMCMSCLAMALLFVLQQAGVSLPNYPVQSMNVLYLVCHLGLFLVMVVFMLLFELSKNQGFIKREQALQIINELAIRDELTGSHKRRHLIELIEPEKERTVRLGHLFCLCLLDIDFFKRVDDTYGHSTGDMVLRKFAQTVQRQIRDIDSFGRYGGEKFLLMLSETSIGAARTLAERVRTSIGKMGFHALPDLVTTVSIGVAQFCLGESIAQTVARADEALYLAKSGGRDRVLDYNDAAALSALEGATRAASTRMVARFDASQCDPLTGLLNRRMPRDRLNQASSAPPATRPRWR